MSYLGNPFIDQLQSLINQMLTLGFYLIIGFFIIAIIYYIVKLYIVRQKHKLEVEEWER